MADNVSVNPGTTTPIATDDVAGVQFQKVKINLGGDGVDGNTWDGKVTGGTINAGTVVVSSLPDSPGGTVDVVSSVSNLVGGTVTSVQGGSIVVTAGTVTTTIGDISGGTIDLNTRVGNVGTIESGTISVLSSLTNLAAGTVTSVESLPDLPGGTVDLITSISNLVGGTITSVQGGSIVVTNGTIASTVGGVTLGSDTYAEATSKGVTVGAVRNDALATLADTDNEFAPLQVDSRGALYVNEPNLIDTNNSSTSTLAGDAIYTGTGTDVSQYAVVTVQLDASHDSATDGMTFQFSTNNSDWDDVYTFTYTAADGARRFQFPITAQYFRVVYTNGSTIQTHFRLQTILHANSTLTSIHRLVDDVKPDRSSQLVKSALIAQVNGSGDFTPIQANSAGILKVGGNVDVDSLPDLPGGTVDLVTAVSSITNLAAGTITRLEGGTVGLISNLANGTIRVTNGTIDAFTADIPGGTIDTVSSITTLPDLPGGTIDSLTNLAGGTVQINPRPTTNIINYGTSIGGTAATGVTLLSAPGSGTSIYINEISVVNRSTATAQVHVGFGTASTQGTSQVLSGVYAGNGGIQKSYPKSIGGHITNLALLGSITAAGTVDVHLSYWVQ